MTVVHRSARRRAAALCVLGLALAGSLLAAEDPLRFEISFAAAIRGEAADGRVFVMISSKKDPEPRETASGYRATPFFGEDVEGLHPGAWAAVTASSDGYPLSASDGSSARRLLGPGIPERLHDLPPRRRLRGEDAHGPVGRPEAAALAGQSLQRAEEDAPRSPFRRHGAAGARPQDRSDRGPRGHRARQARALPEHVDLEVLGQADLDRRDDPPAARLRQGERASPIRSSTSRGTSRPTRPGDSARRRSSPPTPRRRRRRGPWRMRSSRRPGFPTTSRGCST